MSNRRHHRRRDRRRRPLVAVVTLAAVVPLAGCGDDDEAESATCAAIVSDAAFEAEVRHQIRGLDRAIETCGSYEELTAEMENYPYLVGYPTDAFLERRCDDVDELAASEVCRAATPEVSVAEQGPPPYTGKTLTGEIITVTADEVPFVGDVPEVVQRTVAVATEVGCVGVLGIRDDHATYASDDSRAGKIQSMFAQHAQNVADYVGCVNDSIISGPPTTVE